MIRSRSRSRSRSRTNDFAVPRPQWKRFAEKVGIQRVSEDCFDLLNTISIKFIKTVFEKAIIYTEHAKRKTLSFEDVIEGIRLSGFSNFFVDPKNPKKCKVLHFQKFITRMRKSQQQSDCLITARAPFKEYVKQLMQSPYTDEFFSRYSKLVKNGMVSQDALIALQFAFETFIVRILDASTKAMQHAKRMTLHASDIEFVLSTVTKNCAVVKI